MKNHQSLIHMPEVEMFSFQEAEIFSKHTDAHTFKNPNIAVNF